VEIRRDHDSRPAQAKSLWDLISTNKACYPSYLASINMRIKVQAGLDVHTWERAGGMNQVVGRLLSKCEALSTNTNTLQKPKQNKKHKQTKVLPLQRKSPFQSLPFEVLEMYSWWCSVAHTSCQMSMGMREASFPLLEATANQSWAWTRCREFRISETKGPTQQA
jgi:hypothetical protein